MLLVDHDQGQILKGDFFLNQGVRADAGVNVAGGQGLMQDFLLARFQRTNQELDAVRRLRENTFDVAGVLFGENFSRDHQRGLITVLQRRQHGDQRHDRFAAADVALQQTIHRRV